MRLLLVHNFSRDFNGEDAFFNSLADLLRKKNEIVSIYTKNNNSINRRVSTYLSLAKNISYSSDTYRDIARLVKYAKPDIAHIHNIYPLISPSVYYALNDNSVPMVQTIHNYRLLCPGIYLYKKGMVCTQCIGKKFKHYSVLNGCYRRNILSSLIFSYVLYANMDKAAYDKISRIVFPTRFCADLHKDHLKIPKNKIDIVPYFVNKQIMERVQPKGKYFLYAGRLSEEKGILQLLDIFQSLPQIRLIVIGKGPLQSMARKFSKYKNILFENFSDQERVYAYMKGAIATVIPSLWYEVLPMVMLESFAQGTPVIVPDYGIFRETVHDGKIGFKYKQFARGDLRNLIIHVYRKRSQLSPIRKNIIDEYRMKYSPELFYQSMKQVYLKAVHE